MAADGTIIIDTLIDTDGFQDGSSKAKKTFTKIATAAAAIGTAIAAFAEFGKASIDTASDLQEVQNVVDVTFETMSEGVNQFAKDAQKSAGLSEKMAKQYVGTFGAMADSFGYTEQQAYEMSTTLTQLTGDVASFYNLSQDEAAGKLKGIFTGETEALKELGVVMTQTALDSYALANGFGKTTDAMSEQEKVTLRYQFVMDKLSAASGDFVRTQDSWANQTKVLALQYETLQGVIGTGLIEAFTPTIKYINDKALPALINWAETMVDSFSPKPLKRFQDQMKDAEQTFSDTTREIEANAYIAEYYAEKLVEMSEAGLETAEAQREYANTVELLNEVMPDLNLTIDENTHLITMNNAALLESIEALKQKAFYTAVEERYSSVLAAQAELILDRNIAEKQAVELERQLTEAQNELNKAYADADAELAKYGALSFETGQKLEQLETRVEQLTIEQDDLTATINATNNSIAGCDTQIAELEAGLDQYAQTAGVAAEAQTDLTEETMSVTDAVADLEEAYIEAKASARESVNSQIGYFDALSIESSQSASEIIQNWRDQKAAFEEYTSNLEKAVNMGLDESLVKQLADGSAESMAILDEFVNSTDVSVGDINKAFKQMNQARETTSNAMAEVKLAADKQYDSMISAAQTAGADTVSGLISGVLSKKSAFASAVNTVAQSGLSAYKRTYAIKSPSRVMMEAGDDTIEGAIIGIEDKTRSFINTISKVAERGSTAFLDGLGAVSSFVASGSVTPPMTAAAGSVPLFDYGAFESIIGRLVQAQDTSVQDNVIHVVVDLDGRTVFDKMIEEAKTRQDATGQNPFYSF